MSAAIATTFLYIIVVLVVVFVALVVLTAMDVLVTYERVPAGICVDVADAELLA